MTTSKTTWTVESVSWQTVTVTDGATQRYLDWDRLAKAAKQDDADLRAEYGRLLADARDLARNRKMVKVVVRNLSGGPDDLGARTWAALLVDPAGEHVSGRIVGADFGQTGTRTAAIREADEARQTLRSRGYDVGA